MSEVKTKANLIDAVSGKTGLSKKDSGHAVDAVLSYVTETLEAGDALNIPGFGKFSVSEKPAREGRNPSTGETVQIAARNAPKFSAGKALKDAVNK